MLDRKQIKLDVRAYLKGRWWMVILAVLLVGAVAGAITAYSGVIAWIPVIGWLASMAVFVAVTPFSVSLKGYILRFARGENPHLEDMFTSLKGRYYTYMGAFWWQALWVWLWSMLLIVPGIVKAIAYSFTFYIINENPGIGAQRALKLSIAMTDGHKGELFVLALSFFWWWCIYVFAYFYVTPYYETSYAVYYEKFKERAIAEGRVNPADFYAVQQ